MFPPALSPTTATRLGSEACPLACICASAGCRRDRRISGSPRWQPARASGLASLLHFTPSAGVHARLLRRQRVDWLAAERGGRIEHRLHVGRILAGRRPDSTAAQALGPSPRRRVGPWQVARLQPPTTRDGNDQQKLRAVATQHDSPLPSSMDDGRIVCRRRANIRLQKLTSVWAANARGLAVSGF